MTAPPPRFAPEFAFDVVTTLNDSSDPAENADFVTLKDGTATETFTRDGTEFNFEIVGFSEDGGETFTTDFSAQEEDKREADVFARITQADPTNRAPDAAADKAATDAGESVVIDVLANDRDPDGDTLIPQVSSETDHGDITVVGADNTVRYTPDEGFTGRDTFSYTLTDGAQTDTAEVTVDVGETSDPTPPRAILKPEATLDVVDSAEVLARSGGDEGIFLREGVGDVELGANMERIETPRALSDLTFQVGDDGLAISAAGETLVTLPSLNQPATLALADGSATLTQTGANTFELATSLGATEIGPSPVSPTLALDPGDATAPSANDPDRAANVFVDADGGYTLADAVDAFGRSGGNEMLALTDRAQNVEADANFERLDFAQPLDALTFDVGGDGLTVSEGATTLLTIPSLNGEVDLRFADGNITLRQTGATRFEFEGEEGDTATIGGNGGPLDVSLGDATSSTAEPDMRSLGPEDNGRDLDAGGGNLTFDLASGDYTLTIDGFAPGDALDASDFSGASVTFTADGDQADGEQALTLTDPATGDQATVTLVGLTETQDAAVFNTPSFADTFGDDALML